MELGYLLDTAETCDEIAVLQLLILPKILDLASRRSTLGCESTILYTCAGRALPGGYEA